jgi:hypothetical protein
MKKSHWKLSILFFSFCLLGCGITSKTAIQPYVRLVNKMEKGVKKEETFLQMLSSSGIKGQICERYFFHPRLENIFYTNLGSDLVIKGNDRYETVYVYTKTVKKDNKVTKDEMTPLVFLNGSLLGKGWNFYDSLFVD